MSATCFAELIEQLQPFPIRHNLIFETLRLVLILKERREGGRACLIHFIHMRLDFWFWNLQELE